MEATPIEEHCIRCGKFLGIVGHIAGGTEGHPLVGSALGWCDDCRTNVFQEPGDSDRRGPTFTKVFE